MKPENSTNPDGVLRSALREWKLTDPLPPRFHEQVWQRIARAEAQAVPGLWRQFSNWLANAMARPSLAVSYVTILLLTGLLAGYWHGRADSARATESLGTRYVQMIDPYQKIHP